MREMVLNHASLDSPDQYTAVDWLKDVTVGMAQLVDENIAERSLRSSQSLSEIFCLPEWSLWDAILELQVGGARDEYLFLVRLSAKVPLLSDVGQNVADRFQSCEAKTLPPKAGEPLVLCAITDGIAVGFPSDPIWDQNQVTVSFDELLPDGNIGVASETIDNLTRSAHALPICERHRADLRQFANSAELWESREEAFPNLVFGPDVERNLTALDSGTLSIVVKRLVSLDESASEWRVTGGTMPTWKCHVTPESPRVRDNPKLLDARRFKSHHGTQELFEWHARFGNSGRIHLRFDPSSYEVEIGYIGPHLPL